MVEEELQKTKKELAIAKRRQAKPCRAHTREACISAPLSSVAELRFSSGIENAEKEGDTDKHQNDTS